MQELIKLMNEISLIVKQKPVEDAVEAVMRRLGLEENKILSLEALIRLVVIESSRARHAEAKYFAICRSQDQPNKPMPPEDPPPLLNDVDTGLC